MALRVTDARIRTAVGLQSVSLLALPSREKQPIRSAEAQHMTTGKVSNGFAFNGKNCLIPKSGNKIIYIHQYLRVLFLGMNIAFSGAKGVE
jgi:hypothetical protein